MFLDKNRRSGEVYSKSGVGKGETGRRRGGSGDIDQFFGGELAQSVLEFPTISNHSDTTSYNSPKNHVGRKVQDGNTETRLTKLFRRMVLCNNDQ